MPSRAKESKRYASGKKLTKSLREHYEEACSEQQVTPNSVLLNMFPEKVGRVWGSDTLDLSSNYVGDKGFIPVISVLHRSPQLQKIIVSDNGLRNRAVQALASALAQHPEVTAIDLSDNYISLGAGDALEHLLKQNRRIIELNITNTKIDVDQRLRIKELLRANAEGECVQVGDML
eukprot:TRINITY_DN3753_c3_g1_i1.p1 TRINITY_DN3753_c3_g1~~TRINITY_DN3753_c3_g1_i1.p1  ORF type:complete len:185 (+),score=33.94 TRINITY_DN3753_c3_g1_i1:30-557(+)